MDTGLRSLLTTGSALATGHLIENVVFLELFWRGYKVNIGRLAEKEIDFVAGNIDGLTYYQVSASVLDHDTLINELKPLRQIPEHHPKVAG